jgi:hypothetical protein
MGKAIMEESVQEPTHGRWLAKNLSNVASQIMRDDVQRASLIAVAALAESFSAFDLTD